MTLPSPFRRIGRFLRFGQCIVFCVPLAHSVAAPPPAQDSPPPASPPAAAAVPVAALPEVVVTATRTDESLWDTPATVTVLDQDTILRNLAETPTDMLKEQPGVFANSVGSQGSPIIRGQIGNSVLYLWDGVRINNGALFAGPNPYFNQFPIGAVDRMEVILGSGSVQYGSDAIGGVINVIPKKAVFTDQYTIGGDVDARYGSNADENVECFDLHISDQRFALAAGISRQQVGDYYGAGVGTLPDTSFHAFGGYADLVFKPAPDQTLRFSFVGNERRDVNSYIQSDINANGIPGLFNPLESRGIGKVDYTLTDLGALSSELKFYGYYQYYDQVSQRRVENYPDYTNTTTDTNQDVLGFGVQNTSNWGPVRLIYGVDYRHEKLQSSLDQELFDYGTGLTSDYAPLGDTPNGTYDVLGAFLSGEYRPVKPLLLTAGLRFENTHIDSQPLESNVIPNAGYTLDELKLDKSWQSLTWDAGSILSVTKAWDMVANISTAFRAPTYSDLFSTGTPVYSSKTASVPSPDIDPERSITYELGTRYHSDTLTASLTAYTTQIYDNVVTTDTGTVEIPGEGTFIASSRTNDGTGYVRGVETSVSYHPATGWTLFGNGTYTFGQDTSDDVPLRFIPPLYGTVGIRFESPSHRWWVEATEYMAGTLSRINPQDDLDAGFSRNPALGSPNSTTNPPLRNDFSIPGFAITNLRGGWRVWQHGGRAFDLTLTLSNLFNHGYREAYAQQELVAPGFGATIDARLTF